MRPQRDVERQTAAYTKAKADGSSPAQVKKLKKKMDKTKQDLKYMNDAMESKTEDTTQKNNDNSTTLVIVIIVAVSHCLPLHALPCVPFLACPSFQGVPLCALPCVHFLPRGARVSTFGRQVKLRDLPVLPLVAKECD